MFYQLNLVVVRYVESLSTYQITSQIYSLFPFLFNSNNSLANFYQGRQAIQDGMNLILFNFPSKIVHYPIRN